MAEIEWTVVITLHGDSAMSTRERVAVITFFEDQGWEVKGIGQFKYEGEAKDAAAVKNPG